MRSVCLSRRKRPAERLRGLLSELGKRRMTNVLVEGGSNCWGVCWIWTLIDEVHVFVAPKLVGGQAAASPLAGIGRAEIPDLLRLYAIHVSKSSIRMSILRDV